MSTKIENFENEDSCWNRAEDEEQMFVLLGRDRHAPALIRLWAAMREKEGEDEEVVNEAREVAQLMEDEAVAHGRVTLSLDAVSSFAATLKERPVEPAQVEPEVTDTPVPYVLKVGQIVCAGHGRPAKLLRIFGYGDEVLEAVRGMANIQVPGHGPATVKYDTLRHALPDEIEAYRNAGGRM